LDMSPSLGGLRLPSSDAHLRLISAWSLQPFLMSSFNIMAIDGHQTYEFSGRREGWFGNGVKNLKGSKGRPVQAFDPAHSKLEKPK
jgi:hypothetical protein